MGETIKLYKLDFVLINSKLAINYYRFTLTQMFFVVHIIDGLMRYQ